MRTDESGAIIPDPIEITTICVTEHCSEYEIEKKVLSTQDTPIFCGICNELTNILE